MIDTHCHIHGHHFPGDSIRALEEARSAGVTMVVNVGTNARDSKSAVTFAKEHNLVATVAQHPHDTKDLDDTAKAEIAKLAKEDEVVGIGECGLDYYYNHSDKTTQVRALEWHLQLAKDLNKPLSFHIRDAFDDFWDVYDQFSGLRGGVVHSFTAYTPELEAALTRGLYVAFNGIMTFTKDEKQLEALRTAPLERIVIETDAPFLTPVPLRGKVNEPKHIPLIIEKIAAIKGIEADELARTSTENAKHLFNL